MTERPPRPQKVIPISLLWEDIKENMMSMNWKEHQRLHQEQNISAWNIRNFRKKINWILVPDEYFFDVKKNIWQSYFVDVRTQEKRQKTSLMRQSNRYYDILWTKERSRDYSLDFDDLIQELIDVQKGYVRSRIRELNL